MAKGLPKKKTAPKKEKPGYEPDDSGEQLSDAPVIFPKGPIAQADPVRKRK